jgi:hypothetical protein
MLCARLAGAVWGAGLVLTLAASPAAGQAVVTTTAYRVPAERLDSLRSLIRALKPAIAEAKRKGGVLDEFWLLHVWGDEYNAVEVITWASWGVVGDTTLSVESTYPKLYPDPAERRRVIEGWNWVFAGVPHRDNIYRRVE